MMKYIKHILAVVLISTITSCVQETHLKTFVFKVDLSNVNTIINPGVKGQFTSPPWEVFIPLNDDNNDGVYEGTVAFEAAQYGIQFKFVNNDIYELEDQDNRFIKLEYKPETIVYEAIFNNPKGKQKSIN